MAENEKTDVAENEKTDVAENEKTDVAWRVPVCMQQIIFSKKYKKKILLINIYFNKYIMRIIPYSTDVKPRNADVIVVPKNESEIPYVNYNKHNIINTKENVFPDKYVHKHNWLKGGYKSTYKKDFINHKKPRDNKPTPPMQTESKHNYINKLYPPPREINYIKNTYINSSKNFIDWNNPYK